MIRGLVWSANSVLVLVWQNDVAYCTPFSCLHVGGSNSHVAQSDLFCSISWAFISCFYCTSLPLHKSPLITCLVDRNKTKAIKVLLGYQLPLIEATPGDKGHHEERKWWRTSMDTCHFFCFFMLGKKHYSQHSINVPLQLKLHEFHPFKRHIFVNYTS